MSRLHQVARIGQGLWLDDLRRDLVSTGELARLFRDDAITGVTSNPTIFANAITGSDVYDDQLEQLAQAGAEADEAYVALVTEDIRGACDVFRDEWHRTERRDGWASIEVSPRIAYDTEATILEVREWVKRIDRDNLFVKVPATAAGVPAIERLTAEGISINVTLVFSLDRYREVANAYITGVDRYTSGGGDPARVQSVASFFVSRVDTEVDRRLDELAERNGAEGAQIRGLKGLAGVANARAAYGIFLDLFGDPRWKDLEQRGARAQRPLWASTGVKDPAYRDTMYVEDLIAPNTVVTMPAGTIRAFQDHGRPEAGPFTVDDIARSNEILRDLEAVGIDYNDVTEGVLEREGVQKFDDSFDKLLGCIESKKGNL
jgi:transaldolase